MAFELQDLHSVIDKDGAAILQISRNRILTLNRTGGFVWTRLQLGIPVQKIVDELAAECNVDPDTVRPGVLRFINHLRSECLLLPEMETIRV